MNKLSYDRLSGLSDAGIEAVTEGGDQLFGRGASGPVGDLLGKYSSKELFQEYNAYKILGHHL